MCRFPPLDREWIFGRRFCLRAPAKILTRVCTFDIGLSIHGCRIVERGTSIKRANDQLSTRRLPKEDTDETD